MYPEWAATCEQDQAVAIKGCVLPEPSVGYEYKRLQIVRPPRKSKKVWDIQCKSSLPRVDANGVIYYGTSRNSGYKAVECPGVMVGWMFQRASGHWEMECLNGEKWRQWGEPMPIKKRWRCPDGEAVCGMNESIGEDGRPRTFEFTCCTLPPEHRNITRPRMVQLKLPGLRTVTREVIGPNMEYPESMSAPAWVVVVCPDGQFPKFMRGSVVGVGAGEVPFEMPCDPSSRTPRDWACDKYIVGFRVQLHNTGQRNQLPLGAEIVSIEYQCDNDVTYTVAIYDKQGRDWQTEYTGAYESVCSAGKAVCGYINQPETEPTRSNRSASE
jgi:hypothetical protein